MRVAVISDAHIPFHDSYAVDLAVRVVQVWQPDLLIYDGDMLDMYELSTFDRNPERFKDGGLQAALDTWTEIDGRFRQALPTLAFRKFVPGNHEDRLRRWLWRNNALYGLRALELPTLMGLEEKAIEFCPIEVLLAGDSLGVKHGDRVRREGGMSAAAELALERFAISTITGHTHRLGSTFVTTRRGVVGAWENACLCRLTPEFVVRPNWQHGMTLVEVDGDSFLAWNVPFLGHGRDMKCLVSGQKVRL